MWDTRSHFTAQTSAWCGMATVSGTGFVSQVSTSTSGSTDSFRKSEPGLRKWQSLSHLAPGGATRSFPPSPGAALRAVRGESSLRQAEVGQWLQGAHEHLDIQLNRPKARNSHLSYNITTAQLLDMKYKQLSEAMSALKEEKGAAKLSQSEKSRQQELHEKVLQLERDLLQMRSTLDRESNAQPTEKTPDSLSSTLPISQEDFNGQEKQRVDTEVYKLREALRNAEVRAKTQEEERNQALQKLKTFTETQRTQLDEIDELTQRLSNTRQNHSEVQEQLSEANNKISQACLEKAILSAQVLKLEDNIKELKAKLSRDVSYKDQLIQEKADLQNRVQVLEQSSEGCEVLIIQADTDSNNKRDQEIVLLKQESKALREVNEKLTFETEEIKEKLKTSQSELQEITEERVVNSKQIKDLQATCSQLLREKEERGKMNEVRHEELTEMKEQCCQLRESLEGLKLEKLKLQDQCLCLEAEVFEREEKLHLQEEEYRKQDAVSSQITKDLKAMVSHWTEKWQKVALTLQATQEELEKLKKNKSRNELQAEALDQTGEIEKLEDEGRKDKHEIENLLQHKANMETVLTRAKESESLLRLELDACKQELELEKSRSQALFHRYKDKGEGCKAMQTEDTETVTDLSESSLFWVPPSDSQSSLNKSPQEESLSSVERLREMEINEAELKISVLEVKVQSLHLNSLKHTDLCYQQASECGPEDGSQANVSTTDSLRTQPEETRRRVDQLQQEKTLAVQKIQTIKQLYQVKDEKSSVEDKKDKTVYPVNLETDQQRRMVTEQNNAVERRSWQKGSGLMPVVEEDEESSDWPGGEWGDPAEEKNPHNPSQQMSTMSAEISNLKTINENLLQASLSCKQPIQDCPPAADKSSDAEVLNLFHCSDEIDSQRKKPLSLYPDGIFMAKLVDVCSPDEDEEDK
ncbi:uncharacterized protein [Pempheris klunzingeri]|uniref:uncharacterized protein n=1 Tax=Pempheris klunzingeri TaxID=3127111 RepID=UPI00397F1BAF